MVRVEIDERTKAGRVLLALVKLFSEKKKKGVRILEPTGKEEALENLQLTAEEKAFYGKFREAVEEVRAMEAGELEARPLKEVLDEL